MRILRNYPDLMTVDEARTALNIGRSTMYKLINSKQLKVLRIGTKYRIPKPYLIDFITQNA